MPLVIVAGGVALLLLLMITSSRTALSLVLVAWRSRDCTGVCRSIRSSAPSRPAWAALGNPWRHDHGLRRHARQAAGGLRRRTAHRRTLIDKFGRKHIQWAVVLTGHRRLRAVLRSGLRAAAAAGVHHRRLRAHSAAVRRRADGRRAVSMTHGFLPPREPDRHRHHLPCRHALKPCCTALLRSRR